jgi:hypothetical protein
MRGCRRSVQPFVGVRMIVGLVGGDADVRAAGRPVVGWRRWDGERADCGHADDGVHRCDDAVRSRARGSRWRDGGKAGRPSAAISRSVASAGAAGWQGRPQGRDGADAASPTARIAPGPSSARASAAPGLQAGRPSVMSRMTWEARVPARQVRRRERQAARVGRLVPTARTPLVVRLASACWTPAPTRPRDGGDAAPRRRRPFAPGTRAPAHRRAGRAHHRVDGGDRRGPLRDGLPLEIGSFIDVAVSRTMRTSGGTFAATVQRRSSLP